MYLNDAYGLMADDDCAQRPEPRHTRIFGEVMLAALIHWPDFRHVYVIFCRLPNSPTVGRLPAASRVSAASSAREQSNTLTSARTTN